MRLPKLIRANDRDLPHRSTERSDCDLSRTTGFVHSPKLPHRSTERSDCDNRHKSLAVQGHFLTAVRRDPIATRADDRRRRTRASSPQYGEIRLRLSVGSICCPVALPNRSTERSVWDNTEMVPVRAGSSSPQYGEIRLRPSCHSTLCPILYFLTAVRRDPIATWRMDALLDDALPHRSTERSDCDTPESGRASFLRLPHRSTERSDCDKPGVSWMMWWNDFLTAVRRDPIATPVPELVGLERRFLTAVRRDPMATCRRDSGWCTALPPRTTERSDCVMRGGTMVSYFTLPHRSAQRSDGHTGYDWLGGRSREVDLARYPLTQLRGEPGSTLSTLPNLSTRPACLWRNDDGPNWSHRAGLRRLLRPAP